MTVRGKKNTGQRKQGIHGKQKVVIEIHCRFKYGPLPNEFPSFKVYHRVSENHISMIYFRLMNASPWFGASM